MEDVLQKLRSADERTSPPRAFDLEATVRRGQARLRRRRFVQASVGVAAVVGAVAGAFVVTPLSGGSGELTAAGDPSPEDALSLLAEPAGIDDELPAMLGEQVSQQGLVASTARVVTETEDTKFWAAVNLRGEICFVAYTKHPYNRSATGCAEVAAFLDDGLAIPAGPSPRWGDALLVPDGYELSAGQAADRTLVTPNLAVPRDE
ncbi:hypothetical protein [Phytoactinopolyspora mesophila]|uniref:Uncharacterized protein n=1 Tax=Phytoactinopolyspora mesophila TaxID=2650750 RepID=A0A7K3M609_9ACTN|nr:hypothetical protein [Phytoactinopolyspora mesophila]NDL58759.1 hypothetical protein [Phytoactinopolyspora mesophila]